MKPTIAILLGSCWLVTACGGAADAPDRQATTRDSVAAVDAPQDAAAAPDPGVATVTNMSAAAPTVAGAMCVSDAGANGAGSDAAGSDVMRGGDRSCRGGAACRDLSQRVARHASPVQRRQ